MLVFNINKIRTVEFIRETVFAPRKSCAETESEFGVRFWEVYSLSIPSDRWIFDYVKTTVKHKSLKIILICIPLPLAHWIIM